MLTLPIDAVPDITNNQVQIVTVSPTLAPQEIEQLITMPIEIAMSNIMNVENIRSVSRFGLSVVTVVFKESVPTLDARQLINEQIQTVSGEIPPELGTPEMMPITTGLGEIYQYILKVAPGYEKKYDAMELRTIQDWMVKRQLSGIPGIVEINSFGGYLKQYEVAVDPDALFSLNITIGEVFEALSSNNQNTGGSYIEKMKNAYYIRSEGMITDIKDIEQIVVANRNGIPVHISDVGVVRFGAPKRFGAMTMDGEGECVGGIAMMLKGANANVVTQELEKRVEKIQHLLPEGVSIEPYLNRSELVNRNISTVVNNLIEGAIIVFLVLILFLGNIRAGLIVASVIPLAMLFAFIMMRIFNVTANLMSLGAIDFGIVVDGSIVILEGILAHIYGKQFRGRTLSREEMDREVEKGASGVVRSATFAVLIILIVFFPILTLNGIEGKYFTPMAKTLVFCIIGALILSLTYVPMMASLFLKHHIVVKPTLADRFFEKLNKVYQHGLRFCADATGRELIENGLSLISADPGVRRAAIDRLKLHADMCSELGCLLIEGSMRSSIPDKAHAAQCMDWLCQATEELTAYAAARGVEVVIENITASISNYLNTMREVTDFVRRFSCKNLGVHLDTYSMIAEETDIAGAVRYCAPELRYVHFSDTSRFFVGGGNVDFRSHMHALREVGYTGVIAVECRPYPDAYTGAERCIRYMRAMETIVDIERSNFR